jgi:hypothetical protein
MSVFPDRKQIKNKLKSMDYKEEINERILDIVSNIEISDAWDDEPSIKKNILERQKEYFWIRVYLTEDDQLLEKGDKLNITHVPSNEKIEMIFGTYEKEGLNKDHNEQVINYVQKDNKSILCCMIDLEKVNKESNDIPTLRTFFRNSRYYTENIYKKSDVIVSSDKKDNYEYSSIGF